MRVIKLRLSEFLPGTRVFLDVDDFQREMAEGWLKHFKENYGPGGECSRLFENGVCKAILVYLSDGFFAMGCSFCLVVFL